MSRYEMIPCRAMLVEDGGQLAIFECMTCGVKKTVASNAIQPAINAHNQRVMSVRHHVDEDSPEACICCGRDTFFMLSRLERDKLYS